jgi:prepilin-type N-terminal cleavage/methylation domain-containing protein
MIHRSDDKPKPPVTPCRLAPRRPRAFTLIELMVSIALVLILMLGVNTVFRIASSSIGAGNALSDNSRDNRAIQAVINNDFQNALIRSGDMPAFVIRSTRRSAFRDEAEALADRDFQALTTGAPAAAVDAAIRTRDLDDNNVEGEPTVPGEALSGYDISERNHRLDVMSFFARYRYPRQTANDGSYVSDMGSNEAFVWYGHLRQPRDQSANPAVNLDPGWYAGSVTPPFTATNNPNNYYSRQWGLGRVAILMKDPDAATLRIFDRAGTTAQYYIGRGPAAVATADSTAPLAAAAQATNDGIAWVNTITMDQSRYDLAGASISTFTGILKNAVRPAAVAPPGGGGSTIWWNGDFLTTRFAGYPTPTKPLTSYGAARTVPWLVGGCTNFIVEYAGDFLRQDPATGAITGDWTTAGGADGQVDYVVDANGNARIRWYGYPRDVAGVTVQNATVPDGQIAAQGAPGLPASGSPDVLPLRDFISAGAKHVMNAGAPQGAAFEHFTGLFDPAKYNDTAAPEQGSEYVAAWLPAGNYYDATGALVADPPKPSMIRITMTVDDPNGRLPAGQTYEYVINLP